MTSKIKKMTVLWLLVATANAGTRYRDLSIGTDVLDQSLIFQVVSGAKAAKFAPSMSTAARDAISSVAIGAGIWNTTTSFRNDYDGSNWLEQVYSTTTQTITNKSIDADGNTVTNIDNDDIKALAEIERSKIASGTADYVVINSGSGALSEEQFLSKVRGGAGADMSSVVFPSSGSLAVKNAAQTFTEEQTLSKSLVFTELSTTPSTPSTGLKKIYCKNDDKCYQLNDAGSEVELGTGSGGSADAVETPGSSPSDSILHSCKINSTGPAVDTDSGLCGLWIDSVSSPATGAVDVTISAGVCTNKPICHVAETSTNDDNYCYFDGEWTATGGRYKCRTGTTAVDRDANLTCHCLK